MVTDGQIIHKKIRRRIPRNFHQEPVISRLVSDYGLTINITAAILGANAVGDGWFELDLQGLATQIDDAMNYLQDIELEIWDENSVSDW
ncbi:MULTISPECIES: NIL domain-containing protein [unclassified Nodularia (in: cyanobacteria)]|uniref:NIL domain-containing protein n=1 Tax=unclassified Nodularia (in: cyanobacteria) TaxID=2656917 RepID=UPI00188056E2|nr:MULTISPECIES: NIL domain-containing protein [unclassified Nodularia (in: cyanobacteria)]MBE9201690.1 NIL domain-containing protein [Nodularia sp. LEGE 06071]MCC2691282.1 NIL domain-containing protein [Nodularia sp. LEGE 04288]